jgi:hypothetical protein
LSRKVNFKEVVLSTGSNVEGQYHKILAVNSAKVKSKGNQELVLVVGNDVESVRVIQELPLTERVPQR